VQATNLLKMDEPEENPQDFPSRLEPSNYFYTVLAKVILFKN